MKLLVATTGMPGAGKQTLQDIIRLETNAEVIVMRHVVEKEMRDKNIPVDNYHLREFATALRKEFGPAVVAERCIPLLNVCSTDIVLVDGIRSYDEVTLFKKTYASGFVLVAVHSSPKTRFARLTARGLEWDMKTEEEFIYRDEKELSWGLGNAIARADCVIINEGTKEEFEAKCKDFVTKTLIAHYL